MPRRLVLPSKVSASKSQVTSHKSETTTNNNNLFLHLSSFWYFSIVADDILDVTATSEELGKTAGKDEAVDKTTYVKLLGLEKSKSEALRLVAEAKQALAKYGDRALPLLGIADYIVERKN